MNDGGITIIGGGLAGLSLGLALRRRGVPVVLHEAGDYPRHRVCGEFITGLDPATIETLGLATLLADAERLRDVGWFVSEREVAHYQLPRPGYGISRHALDARLAESFVGAGGVLRANSRAEVREADVGKVFATGRRRAIESPWIGLKIHARNLPLRHEVEMHLGAGSYAGLSRIENAAVNICGLFRRGVIAGRGADLLRAHMVAAGLPTLAARLAKANFDHESFCAVSALEFNRRIVASAHHLCLGDSAAMIAPFTGAGMSMAFQSAALAVEPLLAFAQGQMDWASSRQTVRAALRRRFRRRLALAGVLHSFLLVPRRQQWFAALVRQRVVPFQWLYTALH